MSSASLPPTITKLKIAAYEDAQWEIWPWPPPKPPLVFCIGVRVEMTLCADLVSPCRRTKDEICSLGIIREVDLLLAVCRDIFT